MNSSINTVNTITRNTQKKINKLLQFAHSSDNNDLTDIEIGEQVAEIRDLLFQLDKAIEQVRYEQLELTEEDRFKEKSMATEFEGRLSKLRSSFRVAVLAAKQKIEKLDKEQLLSDKNNSLSRDSSFKSKKVIDAASSVTSSLKRTTELLQQEVERSSMSARSLDESSKLIEKTNAKYTTVEGVMQHSKSLLWKLQKSQWLDWFLMFLGFLIFGSTVIYIIQKRIGLSTLLSYNTNTVDIGKVPVTSADALTNNHNTKTDAIVNDYIKTTMTPNVAHDEL